MASINRIRQTVKSEGPHNDTQITRLTRANVVTAERKPDEPTKQGPKPGFERTTFGRNTFKPATRTALADISNVSNFVTAQANAKIQRPTKTRASRFAKPNPAPVVSNTVSSKRRQVRQFNGRTAATTHVTSLPKPISTKLKTTTTDGTAMEPPQHDAGARDAKKEEIIVQSTAKKPLKLNEYDPKQSLGKLVQEAKDFDTEELGDPVMVTEYAGEIFGYLRQMEMSTMPNPDYMDHQGELEWKMRGILVDWLIEVHTRFLLLPETFFLAVNIIDRFLSCKAVELGRLQLVGVTAMFIASKFEDDICPTVQSLVQLSDGSFKDTQLLAAERTVLTALHWDLSYPGPTTFLWRISQAEDCDIQTRTLGKYLVTIGCLDHRFLQYGPSHMAAAAMYLARLALGRGEWDMTLSTYAEYTEEAIQPVFKLMVDYLYSPVVHKAFFNKYAAKKF